MQSMLDSINEWLKELLIEGIILNLSGMFDQVNQKVGEIAVDIGTTPAGWHSGIFAIIRNLSETVILPIAGVILAFVMTYELIQIVIDRNNLHEIDTWIFFKWIFKTFIAVMLVTNTFNIVMGIFDMSQSVVSNASGIIVSDTAVDMASVVVDLEARLQAMEVGPLLGLWFQSLIVGLTMNVLSICIFLVIYGRMIEIYLVTSIGPIPMATLANREWGSIGQNYLRSLLALSFQAFLIIVCVAIYAVLIQSIAADEDISGAIWGAMGYTVLLCFTLFKTGSLAKSIFNAH
ncbi:MAG: CD0415/CD1112 family protein [Eubacteriales bacterium]|nr:CD0415/CD1112 family protein [Eubacteriales bacterium]